jgi:uncharacterized membrane protein
MTSWCCSLEGERGAVLVMVAVFMASAVALVTFVIDVGQWFEHRRHLQLQADAAALAAAGSVHSFGGTAPSSGGRCMRGNGPAAPQEAEFRR